MHLYIVIVNGIQYTIVRVYVHSLMHLYMVISNGIQSTIVHVYVYTAVLCICDSVYSHYTQYTCTCTYDYMRVRT